MHPNSNLSPQQSQQHSGVAAIAPVTTFTGAIDSKRVIRTLQLGMSWLPEKAGSGLDRVYDALIRHLPEVGVDVRGLVAGSARVEADSGGRVRVFAPEDASLSHRLSAARRMGVEDLEAMSFDLVAAHFALYAAPVWDRLGAQPFVVHFHGPWAAESAMEGGGPLAVWVKKAIERAVYGRADRFIVLSSAFRDLLCSSYGVDPEAVRIVPGGVEADRFATGLSRREARRHLGWSADRPILLTVRRLRRRMGLDRLITAMSQLRSRVPEALLLIAGTGPIADELQAQVVAYGLADSVRFLGFVPDEDLPLAYRAADVSIVPTVALEGFGLTTVESLAAGTPVLVTPSGGLPEVVRDLDPRLILPSAESDAIAEGVAEALSHLDVLPSEIACQDYVRQHFSWRRVAEQTRAVYEEVVA